jgi:hypothetical protein
MIDQESINAPFSFLITQDNNCGIKAKRDVSLCTCVSFGGKWKMESGVRSSRCTRYPGSKDVVLNALYRYLVEID